MKINLFIPLVYIFKLMNLIINLKIKKEKFLITSLINQNKLIFCPN